VIGARMAEVFASSFPDLMRGLFGNRPARTEAMADFFAFIVREEPAAVQLALAGPLDRGPGLPGPGLGPPDPEQNGGREPRSWDSLIGYAITLKSMARIWRRNILTLAWLPWVIRFLTGRYGLGPSSLLRVYRSKIALARSFGAAGDGVTPAEVLSVAVAPGWRGRGAARALLQSGLDYLRRHNTSRVKLEVLSDNPSAYHLYHSLGFRPVGAVPYGPTRWIIMILDLLPRPAQP
jgi:ribosomal protein S18 acetylase RimI-like enzyme